MLSPWTFTTDHRGGSREQDFYRKGQTVRLSSPGGDLRQATLTPWAENDHYKPPDHTKGVKDGKTFQLGSARHTKTSDSVEHWLDDGEGKQPEITGNGVGSGGGGSSGGGSQGSQGEQGGQQGQQQQAKPKTMLRQNKEGGVHGRVGEDCRFAAHEKGAKVKAGDDNFVTAHKDGKVHQKAKDEWVGESKTFVVNSDKPLVKTPWKIGSKAAKDSVPDDNKYEGQDQQQGGQGGSGGQGASA